MKTYTANITYTYNGVENTISAITAKTYKSDKKNAQIVEDNIWYTFNNNFDPSKICIVRVEYLLNS